MTQRRKLESISRRRKRIGPTGRRRRRHCSTWLMTDFAVVVVLLFLVCESRIAKRSTDELWRRIDPQSLEDSRDYVLMLVMWKLDQELAFAGRIAKSKARNVAWRDLRVTVRTNGGLGAFEELGAMTTDARIMTRKICNVRVVTNFFPVVSWNLVTGVA